MSVNLKLSFTLFVYKLKIMRLAAALLFLMTFGVHSLAQVTQKHVRNYGPDVNKAGEVLGMALADNAGRLFFTSEKGVLVYDGDRWKMIALADESPGRSLEFQPTKNRLWVGGIGTFGYLAPDSIQHFRYVPVSNEAFPQIPFKQVWQILIEGDSVTFMTNEAHFVWYQNKLTTDTTRNTYVFLSGKTKYYSRKGGGLYVSKQGSRQLIWNHAHLREAVYFITPRNEHQNLLFTPYDGVYVHDLRTDKVTKHEQFSALFSDKAFYEAVPITDRVLALGTWYHGILFTDLEGSLLDQCGIKQGLASDGISDMTLDATGKLWAATDFGVSAIDIASAWPAWSVEVSTPHTSVTQVTVNGEHTFYPLTSQQIRFNRKPSLLRIHFATPGFEHQATYLHQIRLEGLDTIWKNVDLAGFYEYKDLPNGTYRFRVKRISDKGESAEGLLNFEIDEPWYTLVQDNWRYFIGSLAIGLLLVVAFTYRLRVNQKLLTKMVAEKTSEIEKNEKALLAINKELKETNDELDILLYRSSHDLVSPVKSIKGLLHLVRLSPDETHTYLEMMEDRIARLEQILVEINAYVRNVKGDPLMEEFNLLHLVTEIKKELEFMPEARNLFWQIDIDPGLMITSDRARWRITLSNLLGNAVKYSDHKKATPYIHLSARSMSNNLHLTIADNGLGIDKQYQARLFEMFFRATESSSGLGLGLFLVKKVVDSLKGEIVIDSEPAQGTTVSVSVPVVFRQVHVATA